MDEAIKRALENARETGELEPLARLLCRKGCCQLSRAEKKKRSEGYCRLCGDPKDRPTVSMCSACRLEAIGETIEAAREGLSTQDVPLASAHRRGGQSLLGKLNPGDNPSSMGASAMRGITAGDLRTIPNILESHPELLGAFETEHPLRRFEQDHSEQEREG